MPSKVPTKVQKTGGKKFTPSIKKTGKFLLILAKNFFNIPTIFLNYKNFLPLNSSKFY